MTFIHVFRQTPDDLKCYVSLVPFMIEKQVDVKALVEELAKVSGEVFSLIRSQVDRSESDLENLKVLYLQYLHEQLEQS